MEVIYSGGGLANYATIVDSRNPEGSTEFCHYHSVGVMARLHFRTTPHDGHRAAPVVAHNDNFPAIGGRYSVNVTCNGTGNSAAFSPVVLSAPNELYKVATQRLTRR